MPGPSFAPAFAAVGVFLLFLGLVFGGFILVLGVIALVLTLLYWLAEAVRIYDHDIGPTDAQLPAVIHDGSTTRRPHAGSVVAPVPGRVRDVRPVPRPRVRWLAAGGRHHRADRDPGRLAGRRGQGVRETVRADTTGHLENMPGRRDAVTAVRRAGRPDRRAVVLQVAAFAIGEASGARASGAPGASGAPRPRAGGPAARGVGRNRGEVPADPHGRSAPPTSSPAKNIAFVETTFTAPAGKPFKLAFDNQDAGMPHNIEIKDASGTSVFKGEIFSGVDTDLRRPRAGRRLVQVPVHRPSDAMTGTATSSSRPPTNAASYDPGGSAHRRRRGTLGFVWVVRTGQGCRRPTPRLANPRWRLPA